jgi:hypothetical protein
VGIAVAATVTVLAGVFLFLPRGGDGPATATTPAPRRVSTAAATRALPPYLGSPVELGSWLGEDGVAVLAFVTDSASLRSVDPEAPRGACASAQERLAGGPTPPEVLVAAGSSPDPLVPELAASDVAAKVDLLRLCVRDGASVGVRRAVTEVRRTHALLAARLRALTELARIN